MATQPQRRPAFKPKSAAPAKPAPVEEAPAPAADSDDELALQPNAPEKKQKAYLRRRNLPPPITHGKPIDVGDTSRFLLFGGIVVVVVVLVAVLYVFLGRDNAPPKSAPTPAVPAKVDPKKPAEVKPEPAYASNPANRTSYFAWGKFMEWAYTDGLTWHGDKLYREYNKQVPQTGIDDPELIELHQVVSEIFKTGGEQPLRRLQSTSFVETGPGGKGTLESTDLSRAIGKLIQRMKELSAKLKPRYGTPK